MMEFKSIYLPLATLGGGKPMVLGLVRVPDGHDPTSDVLKLRAHLKERGSAAIAWDRRSWAQRLLGASDDLLGLASFVWVTILAITALMAAAVLAVAIRGRYREIAIRRIEGARRVEILGQLLWEHGLLSLAAGLLGLLLASWGCRYLEDSLLGWPVKLLESDCALILAAGIGLLLLTTLPPAYQAASLSPVATLRKP